MTEFFIDFLYQCINIVGVVWLLVGVLAVCVVALIVCVFYKWDRGFLLCLLGSFIFAVCVLAIGKIGRYYAISYTAFFCFLQFLLFCVYFGVKSKNKKALDDFVKDTIFLASQKEDITKDDFPLKRVEKSKKRQDGDIVENLSVSHALSLVDKLSVCKLTPSERSELKEIYDSLTAFNGDKQALNQNLNALVNLYARYNSIS